MLTETSPGVCGANYRRERGLRHAPGILGPVFRHAAEAIHRIGAEARAQMFDERGHLVRRRVATLAGGPQRFARERPLRERAAAQFATPHRLGKPEVGQALAQQRLKPRGIRLGRGQPQRARRRRRAVVMETALQRGDAALPRAQELLELIEQGPQRFEDAIVIFDFMIEIEAPHVTLAPREPPPRIGAPPQQAIEIRQRCRTETPGKPGARQAQQLAERAHAHGQQPRIGFFGPAQDADRQ